MSYAPSDSVRLNSTPLPRLFETFKILIYLALTWRNEKNLGFGQETDSVGVIEVVLWGYMCYQNQKGSKGQSKSCFCCENVSIHLVGNLLDLILEKLY